MFWAEGSGYNVFFVFPRVFANPGVLGQRHTSMPISLPSISYCSCSGFVYFPTAVTVHTCLCACVHVCLHSVGQVINQSCVHKHNETGYAQAPFPPFTYPPFTSAGQGEG